MTGSLQIKNDTYYAVLNVYDDKGKRKPKWINTGLPARGNKKKAKQKLQDLLVEYSTEQYLPKSERKNPNAKTIYFFPFIKGWLETVKPSIAPATYQSYSSMINGRLKRYFEKTQIRLDELTAHDIAAFYQTMFADGLVSNTVIHYHAIIRKALDYAVKMDMIIANPALKVDKPKKNKYVGDYLEPNEIQNLLKVSEDDNMHLAIVLASYYGLRRSEALGVRKSAIHFGNGYLEINHKIVEVNVDGKYVPMGFDTLKNDPSHRAYPLLPPVTEAIKAAMEKQDLYRKLMGKSYTDEYEEYLCVDQMGKILRPNYITGHFKWLLNKYGIKPIRFHDLRHSCATMLLAAGVPMEQISYYIGHGALSTTSDIYAHREFKLKLEPAKVMVGLLDPAAESNDSAPIIPAELLAHINRLMEGGADAQVLIQHLGDSEIIGSK